MKTLKFKPGKERFRATFSASDFAGSPRFGKIDEEKGILNDVQINLVGEAKGHGVYLGEDFITAVAEQGNAAALGIKVRFGHPNMCADALGTFLGRAKNFSVKDVARADGSTVKGTFADIHLAEEAKDAPSGDLYKWTLLTAKNSPDTFGQSIVFTYADFYVLDAAGEKHLWTAEEGHDSDDPKTYDAAVERWQGKSADGRMYAVIDKLHGTDFTDTPAATDGVFGVDDLATQATAMLDDNPRILELLTSKPDTVSQFLDRYNEALSAAGKPTIALMTAADKVVPLEEFKRLELAHGELTEKFTDLTHRFTGLQSAKDKEIALLTTAASAAKTDFESQLAKLQSGLDSAQTELSAALEAKAKTADALALTGEQLKAKETALAKLTGATLANNSTFSTWQEAHEQLGYQKARNDHPELYEAFMASNRKG